MAAFKLAAIPAELNWQNQPLDWRVSPENDLQITAGPESDLFIDPSGNGVKDNSPAALFAPPDACFLLSARVVVDFRSTFDAGVILIHVRNDLWAKFCFEYSPQGQPSIVSVVNKGLSDDCNSVGIDGKEVYLRIAATERAISFHYSQDCRFWHLVRYFSLETPENRRVGFSVQSPTGRKCSATFSEISYKAGSLRDNRNGE
jgi:hypothetical protein